MKKYVSKNVYIKMNKKRMFLFSGIIAAILIGGLVVGRKLTYYEIEVKEQPKKDIKTMETTPVKKEKVFNSLLLESDKQDISYLDDAVFIGDSRVEGFIQNLQLIDTTSYTHKGLNVNAVFRDQFININGKLYSIIDALKQTHFSKVYIMLGINEMGWVYSDIFIDKYEAIIDEIKKINPKATIYIQSILPVSQNVSKSHPYVNKTKILKYNQLLQNMAINKKVYYLNVYECMVDQNNNLPNDAAFDGIHLKKEYCEKWLKYILTHTNQKGGK